MHQASGYGAPFPAVFFETTSICSCWKFSFSNAVKILSWERKDGRERVAYAKQTG
jgi:hypothetical protein